MAWIELHQELYGHPKVVRLATEMNVSNNAALGCIVNLWLWVSMYAKNGDVTNFSDKEMADACNVTVQDITKKLIKTGWIDEKNSKKIVHDWKKHGLRLLEANKRRVRKSRRNKDLPPE